MKASRTRIANAIARAEKRKRGPPRVSKYAAKNRPEFRDSNNETMAEALAKHFKGNRICGNCKQPIAPMSGVCDCPWPGE